MGPVREWRSGEVMSHPWLEHLLLQLDERGRVSPLMAGLLRAYSHHRQRRLRRVDCTSRTAHAGA